MNLKEKISGIESWVRFAIRNKKLTYYLILAMMVVGVVGLNFMNKNEFPSFEIKQGLVAGIYPGASAEEVEQQLTKPLEECLLSYKEVRRSNLHSISRDNVCFIYVDLNVNQNKKDEVWSKLKLGLQNRKMTLPMGVLAIAVLDDFSNTSSLLLSMESPDKSYADLMQYAENLKEELRKIPELSKVEILGKQNEEIAVSLDKEKLSAYGINPTLISANYMANVTTFTGGQFSTSYTNSPIHVSSNMDDADIANHIIYSDPSGGSIRLKDVAKVERRQKNPESFVSFNGHSCLILNVEMSYGHDIVAFGRKVGKVMDDFSLTLPESVSISKVVDQPKVVGTSIWSFLRDLVVAIVVVMLVMLLLFPFKSALIASTGVPVCTAVALAMMFLFKIELNTVTLAALIVVLGMIVDDSIITMDGYMDKLSKGYKGADAAAASAKEIFAPTFMATLAICLMFFPCKYIITGYLGDFVGSFPIIISIALMASLFYAVTVIPSLEVKFITASQESKTSGFAKIQNIFFDFIQKIYEKTLGFCFRHPKLCLGSGVLAVILGVVMFLQLNIQMMPQAARDFFVVELYSEASDGLDNTKAMADSLTRMLLTDSRVKNVTAFIGTGAPRFTATYNPILPSEQTAQLIVNTTSNKATEELLSLYENNYQHIFPSAQIRYKQIDYQAVEAPIAVRFSSNDRAQAVEAAKQLRSYLYTMDKELKWVHSDCDDIQSNIELLLDEDEAARIGLNKILLSLSLSSTFQGQKVATVWDGNQEIPVNLYAEGVSKDMSYEAISNQLVSSTIPGTAVPLRQVADMVPEFSYSKLCRYSGMESITVYADMKSGCSQPAALKKIQKYIKQEIEPQLPEGVSISYNGLEAGNKEVMPEIGLSFLAAVLVLFLFLLIHFKKSSIALLTMALSMLCLFGASFGLWIFKLDFSITAVLGLISLIGIIVRNGMLMFEYAEEARFERGEELKQASYDAGCRRMRPIFLTSCTTALGVLPMILSHDNLWMPMGVVICFGTLLSIVLITLIMPVSYWQLFKSRK